MTPSPSPAPDTVPQPPPDVLANPEALVQWATTPEGREFFRRTAMAAMEARVNAEAAGRPGAAPTTIAVSPSTQTPTQTPAETAQ